MVALLAGHVAARMEGQLATLAPLGDLDRVLWSLWRRRWLRRLGLDRRTDPFAAARALATDLAALLVTQRQCAVQVRDSIENDDFLERRVTLLTSGVANCELMAVALADGLRSLGHAATVWSTGDHATHDGSHTLVHLQSPSGSAFVDGWSDVRVMHVSGVRSAGVGPDRAPPGVPERESLEGLSVRVHGIYPASAYRAGHPKRILSRRVRALGLVGDLRRAPPAAAVWRAYVELRLGHLLGELAEPAATYYARFGERELPESLRLTVTRLAER